MAGDDTDQEVYKRLLDMSEPEMKLPSKEDLPVATGSDPDLNHDFMSGSGARNNFNDDNNVFDDDKNKDLETTSSQEALVELADQSSFMDHPDDNGIEGQGFEASSSNGTGDSEAVAALPKAPDSSSYNGVQLASSNWNDYIPSTIADRPAPSTTAVTVPTWSLGAASDPLRTFSVSPVVPNENATMSGPNAVPLSSATPAIANAGGDGRCSNSPARPLNHTLSGPDEFYDMERQGRGGSFSVGMSARVWNESRRRLHSSKRSYRRLVFKNGECNISHVNIKKRKRRFLADIFTTLVDVKWRYTLLLFICAFIITWVLFALVWWLIGFAHEDFASNRPSQWKPCVENVVGFTTALLFSIETQHTIGYGYRVVTDECPEAVLMVMMQSCLGVIIQALMTGLVFAKLSRPKKRAETLMFSKNAVICKRDGVMTLLFRVGDMRKSHIIEAHIRGILIKKRITREGEVLPMEQYDVDFGFDEGRDRLFLVWPVIIEHKIDSDSPFWEISSMDLLREQFELIVILEGIVESTGMTTQARSSYLPGEILWGHRFEKLITYQKNNGEYQLDYEKFHSTRKIENFPQCSAKDLADIGEENLSAKGLIQDDDVSLASKSFTNTVNSNVMTFLRRNGSIPSAVAQLRQRSVALPEGQTSRFGSFVGSRDQISGVGSQTSMRQHSQPLQPQV